MKPVPPEPVSLHDAKAWSRRLRSWRPLPHEALGIAFLVVGVVLLERLPVHYPRAAIVASYSRWLVLIALLSAVTFLAAAGFARVRRRRAVSWTDQALVVLRAAPLLVLVLGVHFLLKSFIYLVNPRTWDVELSRLDQALHWGLHPGRFATTLLDEPALLRAIDIFYSGLYYPVVVVSVALLLTVPSVPRRIAFAAAFTGLWVAGTALYLLWPSWGPVFAWPDDYQATLMHMPGTVSVQAVLFEEISSLVRDPLAPRVVRYGCVAAFPSMHVAVVTLFAAASHGVSRAWFRINVVIVAVMVVGSVVTGYHYLVDAWAGILLACFAWLAARRLHPDRRACAPGGARG